jgi:3-hydroxyisobutyrate dehydrogenase-like beta-hydroxyacid dehydrogenase
MGGAMIRNLAKAGWQVIGFDIAAARCRDAAGDGIEIADGIGHLARHATFVITSLPSGKSAITVANDIAQSGADQRIVIEASTLALHDKIAFAGIVEEAGHVALDCPVSGTGAQARVGDLVVYGSGDEGSFEASRPLFADFARQAEYLGSYGNGSRMKFVANLLVAIHNVASAEALVLAEKAGLDLKQVVDLVKAGAGNSRIFELRAPLMAEGYYDSVMSSIRTWQKDLTIIASFASELGCALPVFTASIPVYAAAQAQGCGHLDAASVCTALRMMAGITQN